MAVGDYLSAAVFAVQKSIAESSFTTKLIVTSIVILLVSTRISTSLSSIDATGKNGKTSRAPSVPYWVPFLGSSISFAINPSSALSWAKFSCPQGIFKVRLGRRNKTFVYESHLVEKLLESANSNPQKVDLLEPKLDLIHNAFGLAPRRSKDLRKVFPVVEKKLQSLGDQFNDKLIAEATRRIETQVPDMITFASGPIDQHQWERVTYTELLEDKETQETGLFALMQTFLTTFTTSQLLSPALLEQEPDLALVIQSLPAQFSTLIHRPRIFSPQASSIVRTSTTHVTQFLDAVYATEDELEGMLLYDDVHTVDSPFMSILQTEEMKDVTFTVKQSILVYLLTLSIVPHTIVPWVILQLHVQFKGLREKYGGSVREAIDKQVEVTQEPGIGAFRPPPTVHISEKLVKNEAFHNLIAETAALCGRGWTETIVKKDLVLPPKNKENNKAGFEGWKLETGETVIAAPWLSSERYTPTEGDIEALIRTALEPLGMFYHPSLTKYLTHVYVSFIATFLKLYTLEPASGQWKLPSQAFALGVAFPGNEVRVRIRTRDYDINGKEIGVKDEGDLGSEL